MAEDAGSSDHGRGGFLFWKKKKPSSGTKSADPSNASKTGCGGFFRRVRGDGRGQAPVVKEQVQQESANRLHSSPPAPPPASAQESAKVKVQITFDDVELPKTMKPSRAVGGDGSNADSTEGSVNSVCEEIVCTKVKQVESAWVRPPVAAAPAAKEKPKIALSKMASKDTEDKQAPRRPSVDKQPTSLPADVEPPDEAEMERQKMVEARFRRKSVDMRNVKAKGGVKIEQTPHSEMWWNIVNKSLVGTGLFVRAAACSLQSGGIYACNPADFAPTADQVISLRDNFQNPDAFAGAGFAIASTIYKVEPQACKWDLVSAANLQHTEGLLIVKSQTSMLIGGFSGSRDQALETLCAMRELFVSQGL